MKSPHKTGKLNLILSFTDVIRDNKDIYDALSKAVRELGCEPPTYKKVCDWASPWGFKRPNSQLQFSIIGFNCKMGIESLVIEDYAQTATLCIKAPFSEKNLDDAIAIALVFTAAVEIANGGVRVDWKGHRMLDSHFHQFFDENEQERNFHIYLSSDFSYPASGSSLLRFKDRMPIIYEDDISLSCICFIHHRQLAHWFQITSTGEEMREAIGRRLALIPLNDQEQIIPMAYGVFFVASRELMDEITEFHVTRAFFAKVRGVPLTPRRIVRREHMVSL